MIRRVARSLYRNALYSTVPLLRLFSRLSGREYGVGFFQKVWLIVNFVWNTRRLEPATTWIEHVVMVDELLRVPREIAGVCIELGCWKGGSTANLSIACALVGRKLIVCDSFCGLPDPGEVVNLRFGKVTRYEKGDYVGGLEEVRKNVARYGRIEVCEFVPGKFAETLPEREEKYVLVFEDADLPSSVESVLKYTWRRLQEGCKFFTEEAQDFEVVSLFFDRGWWLKNLCCEPPGLVGAGIGLPLGPDGSGLAYAVKSSEAGRRGMNIETEGLARR